MRKKNYNKKKKWSNEWTQRETRKKTWIVEYCYTVSHSRSVPRHVWTHNKATHRNGTRTQNEMRRKKRGSRTTRSSSERKCTHWIELIFSAKLHIEEYSRAFLYAISYLSISIHSLHWCECGCVCMGGGGDSASDCYLFILDLFEIDWQRYIVFFSYLSLPFRRFHSLFGMCNGSDDEDEVILQSF